MNVTTRKNLFILSGLMLGICSSAAFADDTPAAPKAVTVNGGSVLFTGEIVNAACAVDNDSDGQEVKLGQFRAASLAKPGAESNVVPFTIKLTDCDLGSDGKTGAFSKVAVTFSGAEADNNNKAIAVSAPADGASNTKDAAQHVGVEILQNNKPLVIDGSAASEAQVIHAGSNALTFGAAYVATAENATPGVANAKATFQLTYE